MREDGEMEEGGVPPRMKPRGDEVFDLATDTPFSDEPVEREGISDDESENAFEHAQRNMNIGWQYWRKIYDEAAEDISFAYGEQWHEAVRRQRHGRPCHTINMLPQFINQVVGQARKSKFSIRVAAQSGQNSDIMVQGSGKSYPRHVVMEGIIRDIEQRSRAPYAYARALQHAVEGGFGWLATYIVDDPNNPFSRMIHVKHIRDRFSVMIDPHGTETDFSDAMWCSECRDMDEEDFKALFGNDAVPLHQDATTIEPGTIGGNYLASDKEGVVRVSHYWYKVPVVRTAVKMERQTIPPPIPAQMEDAAMPDAMAQAAEMGAPAPMQEPAPAPQPAPNPVPKIERMIVWEDEVKDVLDELELQGWKKTNQLDVKTHIIKYAVLSGSGILDGPHDWPSIYLPIIPVIGRYVDTRERGENYAGLVRFSKDTQRMVNVHFSAATEAMALKPKQFFLVTPEQIRGFESQWKHANTSGQIFLPYKHTPDGASMPTRTSPEGMATGEMQMVAQTTELMRQTIGMHEASIGQRSNEVSGVAIQQRDAQSQVTNYEFMDNASNSVLNVGRNLVDMIPKVYSEETTQRIILADGNEVYVELNRDIIDDEKNVRIRINNLDYSRYTCSIQVGAETRTQREGFVKTLVELSRGNPEIFSAVSDIVFDHIDFPGGSQPIVERLKRAQNPQLLSEEDREKFPPLPPTPEQQIQQLELEVRKEEALTKRAEAEASLKSSELRAHSDDARRDFEIAKGVNRERQDQQREGEQGIDQEAIQKMVDSAVNKAVGRALAKKPKQ